MSGRRHEGSPISTHRSIQAMTHPVFFSVANIRSRVASAVPVSDQILLLGPPYKVPKDSMLQSDEVLHALRLGDIEDDPIAEDSTSKILASTERSGARRLFLFSKQSLSENAPDPQPCFLGPPATSLPTEPPSPSPLSLTSAAPPLHQALAAFERQFMLVLTQGRVLADAADVRWANCRQCVLEQAFLARALRAAVSNHSDHYHSAARTRAEFTTTFQTKTAAQSKLLQSFESVLQSLATIPLHPSLVSLARSSGRAMETLLDTVPVERERVWAQQCLASHQRLESLFADLETSFGELGTPASREDEARMDRAFEEEIETLWGQVEGRLKLIRDRQSQRMERLTEDHRSAVKLIMNAINANSDDEVQAAFTPLRDMSEASKGIIPAMTQDESALVEAMNAIAESKTRAMKRMKNRLRDVSKSQSLIQRVLSHVNVLRDALVQQTENMTHLEHVQELPSAYRDFLSELRRRRAYGGAVTASSTAMMERLASIREDEMRSREKFLRGAGRHLMPAFYELFAPTLATPPPLYTPQLPAMVELDTLPDVGRDDDMGVTSLQGTAVAEPGLSSASTLTAETSPQTPDDTTMASTAPQPQSEQLIVSADEQSSNDLILDPEGGTAVDADVKTLAYENAVLRQAIERLGGKPPRAYVEESMAKENRDEQAEILALRQELAEVRLQAQEQKDALQAMSTQSLSDKISHSSFDVGDVGLFMPTGRGSGGKRTYLAFHTNCPHRYLSTDCIKGTPDFVLGRIVYQEELIAGEAGTDANPYGLMIGTKFWVLTVEVLNH